MSRSWEWGPPGLETPTKVPRVKAPFIMAAFCLVAIFGVPWCQRNFGYMDLQTGNRGCPVIPSEIRSWSVLGDMRRPGEAATLQRWVARNPRKINKQYDAFCETLLHVAAKWGREDLAEVLVSAGANVEAVNEMDERPLHVAAQYGRPTVVKLLVSRGAEVAAGARRGNTPLHAAACGLSGPSNIEGRFAVAKLLLAAGADPNARELGSGFTPLRCATHHETQNRAMADLLFSHGADPTGAEEPRIPGQPSGR